MFSLNNKTAIVTGAGSGIGRAVALTFASAGAHVYVTDLNAGNAESTVEEIKQSGGGATALLCDVSNQEAVVTAFQTIGKIDILVNSAGVSHIGRADNTSSEDFEKVFRVNVQGVYNSLYTAIPLMKTNGGGAIVNLASIAAVVGLSDRFAYSMSKGAVYAMTMSVAKDYISDNIRCNSISPARVHTPFVDGFLAKNYPGKEKEMFEKLSKTQPIGRMGTPDEISKLILYLCSDEASFITGNDYPIDGGFIKLNS
ncbi:SDR family NAD(P)-dependent oxidoreductase [Pararcticibacter amylolyticus]|uniref:Short-chain dehydrogenase n=1 Tax=Pararcticibacter amylolyticus TaxID=2173175 RepID=A0A2U2PAX2_9SPHI|nr:SDR family oxidoreductase [Pararcticibacter amylolyticus]PWG78269.1 short-chain dehydrogenase [Pararcticibacter amylolyticus]